MLRLLVALFLLIPGITFGQVDHWESVIVQGESWRYLLPISQPDPSWTGVAFDDSSWSSGNSGFGYGDDDDATVLPTTLSVYLRKEFTISDPQEIAEVLLHMDYDDGFVAYLNGTEVARAQMDPGIPGYNQGSAGLHEALLYQGLTPEGFQVDVTLLQAGNNILSVEVHNESLTSSDMTAIPVLSVGLTTSETRYQNTPSWFIAPVDFHESELPIVRITTIESIPDEPKVDGTIEIIYNGIGAINRISDPVNEFDGYCGIEKRGSSSLGFPKNNYAVEIRDAQGEDLDTSFLNFPTEEDWVLHGPYSDKSLFNNALAMKLATDLGQYSSRTRFVELVLNDDYHGIYLLMEKIKRDNNRVDIAKLNPDEVSGDDLTGGYIFRIDRSDGAFDRWNSQYLMYGSDATLTFVYDTPDPQEMASEQKAYLKAYVDDFENAMASPDLINNKGRHYSNYIEIKSFVDNFILNELSKDVDAYRLSTFFHKDKDSKGGRIKAGPYWDFNLAFGNGDYCGGDDPTGWEYYQCVGSSPFWWDTWLSDPIFTTALKCRWNELRGSVLNTDHIFSYLDSLSGSMPQAIERNFQRWPILGTYVWPNPPYFASAGTHDAVTSEMKRWISERITWLDANIPGTASDCNTYLEYEHEVLVTATENYLKEDVRVFPNPSAGIINIRAASVIREVTIYTAAGTHVYKEMPNSSYTTVNFSDQLAPGLYFIRINTAKGITSRKLIID